MNKTLTGLFFNLHTIKHINKSGLAAIGLVGTAWMLALKNCMGWGLQNPTRTDPTVPPPPIFLFGSPMARLNHDLLKRLVFFEFAKKNSFSTHPFQHRALPAIPCVVGSLASHAPVSSRNQGCGEGSSGAPVRAR